MMRSYHASLGIIILVGYSRDSLTYDSQMILSNIEYQCIYIIIFINFETWLNIEHKNQARYKLTWTSTSFFQIAVLEMEI